MLHSDPVSLHTLIHTFAILNYPPHFVPGFLGVKCELRDVIHSSLPPLNADTYVLTYYHKVVIVFPNYVVDLLATSRTSSNGI
jgi:hypothetical protein